MRFDAPLYDGDSVIRPGPGFGADIGPEPTEKMRPEALQAKPETVLDLSVAEIEARARAMRAAYIGGLLGRLWDRFEAWLEKGRRAREEAYLAQADNLADLEERMRRIERQGYVPHL
jgi:hypothetical protein